MATTINPLTKSDVDNSIVSMSNDIDRNILKWKRYAEWYGDVTDVELSEVGLTNEDISNFRAALTAMIGLCSSFETSFASPIQKFTKSVVF